MLLAGAHQNSKTVAMLSSMAAAEEGSPQGNIVTGGGEFSLQSIVRPTIWKLEAYHCARDDYTEGVLLDANENAYGACVKSDEALVKAALKFDLHRYPCPHQRVVKDRVLTVSCLDNLIKGAAGAAVQNFNLMYGYPETTGF